MNFAKVVSVAMLIGFLAACSSPQDRAAKAQESSYKAQEKVAKERLKLVEKYQACIKNAEKAAACDSYLKSAEALK
ncbi:MAG: hypothetical protein AMJ63_11980 [Myxococcales bacterium SG8_38_1]|nr:MAG: hypothetical protein AMJ63_11980 [Myxococcales bacterium SG8_38_1]